MSTAAYKEVVEAPATAARRRKAGRVNYLIENATPAMLCLVRAAEPKPYTALSPEALYEAVQPHDHTLRPSPFIAHQALMDFYKVCDGYYGVDREEVDVQQLTAFEQKKPHGGALGGSNSGSNSGATLSSLLSGSASAAPSSSLSAAAGAPPLPSLPSPDDPNLAEKLNDYRIAQLRRNAQHVDNTVYHAHNSSNGFITSNVALAGSSGVCHFYRTPEGCQRGAACPFAHLDKHGQPVNRVAKS
ncbi:conserved hypothetical protein [Leishmania mexicana MHOM/GT/2001/U1103]|uniref:C3H1-type domain-containing protein n=1 Tax=Leishmania mexicana (strain MHOM/GT/2001/U1103) TaxID=929439 RepID=E9AN74_LEIMU|nr:conserved hypothetical protein [Leishmania mexicana MHOM/GT/2001/U1103]CBZ24380.1 conserved hypothetical protein [Leishmania mexicana MHOM/GT/2001/U1103]